MIKIREIWRTNIFLIHSSVYFGIVRTTRLSLRTLSRVNHLNQNLGKQTSLKWYELMWLQTVTLLINRTHRVRKNANFVFFAFFLTISIIILGTEFDIVRRESAQKVFTLEEAIEEASKYSFFFISGSKVMKWNLYSSFFSFQIRDWKIPNNFYNSDWFECFRVGHREYEY